MPKDNEEMQKNAEKEIPHNTREEHVQANTFKAANMETVNRLTGADIGTEISVRNNAADCHLFR